MSITPEQIADFIVWLAAPPWQKDKEANWVKLLPTADQVTMIYGARKALQIMARLPRNSDARAEDIEACGVLFDRMLGQCAYENRPKPNAEVDLEKDDLPVLSRAATYLVEFAILKADEAKKEASFNKQKWGDRAQRRGNQ